LPLFAGQKRPDLFKSRKSKCRCKVAVLTLSLLYQRMEWNLDNGCGPDRCGLRGSAKSQGRRAVVKLDGQTLHLLAGLNADQYAAEMRGQLAV